MAVESRWEQGWVGPTEGSEDAPFQFLIFLFLGYMDDDTSYAFSEWVALKEGI